MRNFEERRAEIFSRSNKRLQIRKRNRSRVIAGCTSFSLLLVISLTVIALPKINDEGRKSYRDENSGTIEETLNSIHIYDGEISSLIEGIENSPDTGNRDEIGTGNMVEMIPEGEEMDYMEIFQFTTVDSEGNEIHYELQGNTLYNMSDGSVTNLTDDQVEKIKEKIDLSR